MTVAPPSAPSLPPRPRRWGLLAVIVIVGVVIGYLALSGVGSALVYYLTPTELLMRGDGALGETVRLGGLVKAGSVEGPADDLRFVVTDGTSEIRVHSPGVAPTRSFREETGVVVQGSLDADGLFTATEIIVKHDENYEAPPPGELPSDRAVDPGQ